MRILAIADDFTGAAEIAGIGWRYGFETRILRRPPTRLEDGLTVLDSDSRLLPPQDAAATVRRFVESLDRSGLDLIYKKTDSAMRGPLGAEIAAVLVSLGFSSAILLPQNPSRGRTISSGIYRIDGVPLDATAFARDPEYPASRAEVVSILGATTEQPVRCVPDGGATAASGINIAEASSAAQVASWAAKLTPQTLPAGGADFFSAILKSRGDCESRAFVTQPLTGKVLFVCGSASSYSDDLLERAIREAVPIHPMPDEVFSGGPGRKRCTEQWAALVCADLHDKGRAMMIVQHPIDRSLGATRRVQLALADAVKAVWPPHHVTHLLLEGGATAAAVCHSMGWDRFWVAGELATGVVQLRMKSRHTPEAVVNPRDDPFLEIHVIVKPGSYPWPETVWKKSS